MSLYINIFRKPSFVFFVCFLFFVSLRAESIKLKKKISVGGSPSIKIFLADIIDSNNNFGGHEWLAKIVFSVAKENMSHEFSRQQIVQKLIGLKKEHPFLESVNFQIPLKLKITHEGLAVKESTVAWQLRRQWRGQCSSCKFVLEKITLPELEPRHENKSWYIQTSKSLPNGRFSSQIVFPQVKGPSSLWVMGQAQTQKLVLTLKRNVAKGVSLKPEWLALSYRNMDKVRGGLLDLQDLSNKSTRQYLMAGDILKASSLVNKILFQRGDAVKLIYKNNGFQMTTQGVAQAIGRVGQSVWVQNLTTKKRISGQVLKTGEVLVQ